MEIGFHAESKHSCKPTIATWIIDIVAAAKANVLQPKEIFIHCDMHRA